MTTSMSASSGARRMAVALIAAALIAGGCGSTAQVGLEGTATPGPGDTLAASDGFGLTVEDTTDAAAGADGMEVTDGAAGTAPGSAPPASAPGSGTTSTGDSGGTSAAGGGKSTTGGTAPRSSGAPTFGPGVTKDSISVGIYLPDERGPGNEELHGIEGVTQGNRERYYDIMRDEINRTGGIAGRKLRYSEFRYSTAGSVSASQLEQSACAHWTQDDRAFVAGFTSTDNFLSCAEKNGLATLNSTLTSSDDRIFATYPHHIEVSAMSLTRQMANLPNGLVAERFFDPGYKLGVVTWDAPAFVRAVEGSLGPSLRRHGKKITTTQRITRIEQNQDLGKVTAEIQSAVLRFKTEGITHVTFAEDSGLLVLLFTRSAENQGYRPRYGLTSQSGPTALAGTVPEGQFDRAVGIGWVPGFDVPAKEAPRNPARDECLAMYKSKGEQPADANNAAVMVGICEEMYLIKAAVEAGGPSITIDTFVRGVEALGSTYPSYTSLGMNLFGPGRHAGAAYYRTIAYDADCVCFHYRSKPILDR